MGRPLSRCRGKAGDGEGRKEKKERKKEESKKRTEEEEGKDKKRQRERVTAPRCSGAPLACCEEVASLLPGGIGVEPSK